MRTVYFEKDKAEKRKFFRSRLQGKSLAVFARAEDITELSGCGSVILPFQSDIQPEGFSVCKPDIVALCQQKRDFVEGLLPSNSLLGDKDAYWKMSQGAVMQDIYNIVNVWRFNEMSFTMEDLYSKIISLTTHNVNEIFPEVDVAYMRNLQAFICANSKITASCIMSSVYGAIDALAELSLEGRDELPEGNIFVPVDLYNAPPCLLPLILGRGVVIYDQGDLQKFALSQDISVCTSVSGGAVEADEYVFSPGAGMSVFSSLLEEGNTKSLFGLRAENPQYLDEGEILIYTDGYWQIEEIPEIVTTGKGKFPPVSTLEVRRAKYKIRDQEEISFDPEMEYLIDMMIQLRDNEDNIT